MTLLGASKGLFFGAPAFAATAMKADLAQLGTFHGLWPRFSWWLTGKAVLRDLPDYQPAIYAGTLNVQDSVDDAILLPTLVVICEACPTPINADDGMDFIKGYAVGCEVLKSAPEGAKRARRLWQCDISRRGILFGDAASVEEIEDPYCRDISVYSDEVLIASGNTDDLTWSVADLVARASQMHPLPEGFVISCGIAVNHAVLHNGQPLTIKIDGLPGLTIG